MAKVLKINHIAIAVPEIEGALRFLAGCIGFGASSHGRCTQPEIVSWISTQQGSEDGIGPTHELIRGGTISGKEGGRICIISVLEVDDLEEMIVQLMEKGVRMIDDIPKILEGRKLAFIHPKSSTGCWWSCIKSYKFAARENTLCRCIRDDGVHLFYLNSNAFYWTMDCLSGNIDFNVTFKK